METPNGGLFSRLWCIREGWKATAIILNCAGPQVLEVYDNIVWENAEDKKPDKVLEALENTVIRETMKSSSRIGFGTLAIPRAV